MPRYEIFSDYGTFEISKTVDANTFDEAFEHTGIMLDLIAAGWKIEQSPDGEEHTVTEISPPRTARPELP
jgi:hypothetical protein